MTNDDKDLFRTILGYTLTVMGDKSTSSVDMLILAGHIYKDIKEKAEFPRPDNCSEEIWDLVQTAILGS